MKREIRTRMSRGDLLAVAAILALAVVSAVCLFPRNQQGLTAQVMQNGEVLLTRSLESLTEPIVYSVEAAYPLTLELSGQGVRVLETACPGQDCRHVGLITEAGQQIVCLPNRLVVTLQGEPDSYDAITG